MFFSGMACSHRRRRRDKTVLSYRVGGVNTTGDQTKLYCLVCSCVNTANADSSKLGRDETKLSCRRCKQASTLQQTIAGLNPSYIYGTQRTTRAKMFDPTQPMDGPSPCPSVCHIQS